MIAGRATTSGKRVSLTFFFSLFHERKPYTPAVSCVSPPPDESIWQCLLTHCHIWSRHEKGQEVIFWRIRRWYNFFFFPRLIQWSSFVLMAHSHALSFLQMDASGSYDYFWKYCPLFSPKRENQNSTAECSSQTNPYFFLLFPPNTTSYECRHFHSSFTFSLSLFSFHACSSSCSIKRFTLFLFHVLVFTKAQNIHAEETNKQPFFFKGRKT